MPFFGPGTAPLTRSRFRSVSTECTVRPTCVTRLPPIRPAIFMPLMTRDGVADAPIEPGVRMLCDPGVTGRGGGSGGGDGGRAGGHGAAVEVVALDRPLEALADADARDLDLLARLED